jgi:hypothetical protein
MGVRKVSAVAVEAALVSFEPPQQISPTARNGNARFGFMMNLRA